MTSHGADDATRAAHEGVVREVMAHISAGRYDDMVALMHEDLVFELPYGPEGFPPSFDRSSFAAMQAATFKLFRSFVLEPIEFHAQLDPAALIAEYRSDAVVEATGAPYRNRYIGVFRFRDGKVAAWREFHNPEAATRALSG